MCEGGRGGEQLKGCLDQFFKGGCSSDGLRWLEIWGYWNGARWGWNGAKQTGNRGKQDWNGLGIQGNLTGMGGNGGKTDWNLTGIQQKRLELSWNKAELTGMNRNGGKADWNEQEWGKS